MTLGRKTYHFREIPPRRNPNKGCHKNRKWYLGSLPVLNISWAMAVQGCIISFGRRAYYFELFPQNETQIWVLYTDYISVSHFGLLWAKNIHPGGKTDMSVSHFGLFWPKIFIQAAKLIYPFHILGFLGQEYSSTRQNEYIRFTFLAFLGQK